jgi:hypothetical protein
VKRAWVTKTDYGHAIAYVEDTGVTHIRIDKPQLIEYQNEQLNPIGFHGNS